MSSGQLVESTDKLNRPIIEPGESVCRNRLIVEILVQGVQIYEIIVKLPVLKLRSELPQKIKEIAMAAYDDIPRGCQGLKLLGDGAPEKFGCFSKFAGKNCLNSIRPVLVSSAV